MIDLIGIGLLSNVAFALAIALVAAAVSLRGSRPQLAHLLWLLVLLKLVTPPLLLIPVGTLPSPPSARPPVRATDLPLLAVPADAPAPSSLFATAQRMSRQAAERAAPWLAAAWAIGSAAVLLWSVVRVARFHRMLLSESKPAPPALVEAMRGVAQRLGVARLPLLRTTPHAVSPMVWWAGGRVRVFLPDTLLERLPPDEWRWVLAHELAHVRRRDHVVRWLEWLAVVVFWWNPITWWAQRNLRTLEEVCCDDLVIATFHTEPRAYAAALLAAIESLATPVLRPPAMASGVNSGGSLEWRFRMIMDKRASRGESRRLLGAVLLAACIVLPLGVASAQDYEAISKRLRAAVAEGELSGEQARLMLDALRRSQATEDLAERRERPLSARELEVVGRRTRQLIEESEGRLGPNELERAGRQMRALIESGDATEASVEELLGGLRQKISERDVDWEQMKARIEGAVERGDLTREEANVKYDEIKRGLRERKAEREERQSRARRRDADAAVDWDAISKRVEAAVERGEISREQADEKYEAIKADLRERKAGREREERRRYLHGKERGGALRREEEQRRPEAATKSGRLMRTELDRGRDTIEEEFRRLNALLERQDWTRVPSQTKRVTHQYVRPDHDAEDAAKQTKEQLEEAREQLEALERTLEEAGDQLSLLAEAKRQRDEGNRRRPDVKRWEEAAAPIELAVERGQLTRSQAAGKYRELRRKRADERRSQDQLSDSEINWASIKPRIEAAVERGDMTREQADAAYNALKR